MVHTYLEWFNRTYSLVMELMGGDMSNCVFSKEEIERLVDLTNVQKESEVNND